MLARLKNAFKNVSPYLFTSENAPAITGGLLLTGAGIVTTLGISYTFSQVVNTLYSGEPAELAGMTFTPYEMIVFSGAVYTANNLISSLNEWILTPLGPRVAKALLIENTHQLMKKDLSYHQTTPFGIHVRRFNKCFSVGQSVSTQLFVRVIPPMLNMTVAVGFISNYGAEIGLGLGGIVAAYTGYHLTTRKTTVKLADEFLKKNIKGFEIAMQHIKEYKTIHDFNNFALAMHKIESSLDEAVQADIKNASYIPKINSLQAVIAGVGYTGLCLLAGRRVLAQELKPSDYAFIGALTVQFLTPLNGLASAINQFIGSLPDIESLFDEFEKVPAEKDPYPNVTLEVNASNASIELKNVRFHYDERTPVLKNISAYIESGKKIGIVGTSGGGKSTLLNLLQRYYSVVSGEILINNQDISTVSLDSLRQAIGIVPQMPVLFNDTLYNNIAFGGLSRPGGVSRADVEAAVDAVCLREFVNALPEGLDTIVGENGAKISGGQRQRIAIARVVLKDPSIVILDEATSALDSDTETEIQANLDTVFKNKTQLVIAHRLGTIQNSDCILVFDKGNIVESGTHEQLLNHDGIYAGLYQSKNATPPSAPRHYQPTLFSQRRDSKEDVELSVLSDRRTYQ